MTSTIGNYSLSAAILVAAGTLLVSLAAVRFGSQELRRTVRRGIYALAALFTLASAALLIAEIKSDFSIRYVADYTERALPLGYKIAAFWAGQAGSVLLWAWMLSVMAAIYVFWNRRQDGAEYIMAAGVLALVIGTFAALMLFAEDPARDGERLKTANPFTLVTLDDRLISELQSGKLQCNENWQTLKKNSPVVLKDGEGMNPMLQNIGMIAHPPILFLGYAGFTIPFALLAGVLLTKRAQGEWLRQARTWTIISWLALGAGIILGAQWAYVELGWGGYWAWDPVENASLLPWLTATALLHSMISHRQRGTFKRWTASLIAASFLLCIFAAYITRGGVVNSVHGFGKSTVGDTIFGMMIVGVLFSAVLIAVRWRMLKGERELDGLLSRDGGFLAGNILFVAMMGLTLLGTIYPVLREMSGLERVSTNASFYNRAVLPLGLAMVALMALAPLLGHGAEAAERLLRGIALPLMAAGAVVVALSLMGITQLWALAAGVVVTVLLVSIVADFIASVRARGQASGENPLSAAVRLLGGNPRRYGAHIVHAGMAMIVIGIVGSSLYTLEDAKELKAGESMTVGNYTVKADSFADVKGPNYDAIEAKLTVTGPTGSMVLRPQSRCYPKWTGEDGQPQPISEVALDTGVRTDVFVAMLVDWQHPEVRAFRVLVKPLMLWIWVGGIVMGLGTIVCLVPRLGKAAEQAQDVLKSSSPARRGRELTSARQVA